MEDKITELLKHGEFEIGYDTESEAVYINCTLYWIEEIAGIKDDVEFTDFFRILNKEILELIQKWWEIEQIQIIEMQEPHQDKLEDHFYIELTEKNKNLNFIKSTEELLKFGSALLIKPSENSDCDIFLAFHDTEVSKTTIDLVESVWDVISVQAQSDEEGVPTLSLQLGKKTGKKTKSIQGYT